MITVTDNKRIDNFIEWYTNHTTVYEKVCEYVHEKVLYDITQQKLSLAYSSRRIKEIDSLRKKLKRTIKGENGYILKYSDPKNQIMDFAGVRFVAYLPSEVEIISNSIKRLFEDNILYDDSENKIDLLGENKVGYLSVHYVVTINSSETQYREIQGLKCEIQIRTVLQDAWAQIFHDRVYKATELEDPCIKRKTNLLSGSLELIDNQIDEVVKFYDSKNGNMDMRSFQNLLNEPISEQSLMKYCRIQLKGKIEKFYSYKQVFSLLSSYGIKVIRELDYCMNDGFIEELLKANISLTIDRLIRCVLLLDNEEKFFSVFNTAQSFYIEKEMIQILNKFIDTQSVFSRHKNIMIDVSEVN